MKNRIRYTLRTQNLPTRMPLQLTLLLPLAVDFWNLGMIGALLAGALLLVLWWAYIGSLFNEKPVDIFEDHEARLKRLEEEA
jgi:hypothetical protein